MKVHELLRDPTRWCQNGLARDSKGQGCSIKSPEARSYCLVGAIKFCYPDDFNATVIRVGNIIKKKFGVVCVSEFNNNTTFDKVHDFVKEFDL